MIVLALGSFDNKNFEFGFVERNYSKACIDHFLHTSNFSTYSTYAYRHINLIWFLLAA